MHVLKSWGPALEPVGLGRPGRRPQAPRPGHSGPWTGHEPQKARTPTARTGRSVSRSPRRPAQGQPTGLREGCPTIPGHLSAAEAGQRGVGDAGTLSKTSQNRATTSPDPPPRHGLGLCHRDPQRVLAVAGGRTWPHHHRGGLDGGVGGLSDGPLLVVGLLGGDDRSVGRKAWSGSAGRAPGRSGTPGDVHVAGPAAVGAWLAAAPEHAVGGGAREMTVCVGRGRGRGRGGVHPEGGP